MTLVDDALSLAAGATVRHGLDVLDLTDTATGEVLAFVDGSVGWAYRPPDPLAGQQQATTAVRRTATLNVDGVIGLNILARRLRLWTEFLLADGTWYRWPLGVFAATNPKVDDDGVVLSQALTLADKSFAWSQVQLADPVYVASTQQAVAWVEADLAARFGEMVFAITSSSALVGGNGLTFNAGTDCLTMYNTVLAAAGYDQLTVDVTGAPYSVPLSVIASRPISATYGAGKRKIVPAGSVEPLLPSLPNVVRFVARQSPSSGGTEGNGLYTVYNYSTGPASINARGGLQVPVTVQVDALDQATLVAVGNAEKQRVFAGGGQRFTGSIGLNPALADRDVISILLPRLGLTDGLPWLVTSWTYPLAPVTSSSDVLMPITAEKKVT